jgi:DNA transformation protein
MAVSQPYLDYIVEQLSAGGAVSSRRMFGGVGLYRGELFFAVIDDDQLHFKVDDSNRATFERAGSQPFRPFPDQPDYVMSYWQVPAEVIEDAEELAQWARAAVGVALAARAKRSTTRARRVPRSRPRSR